MLIWWEVDFAGVDHIAWEVNSIGVDLVGIDFVRVDLAKITHLQERSTLDQYKDTYNALARYSERGLQ